METQRLTEPEVSIGRKTQIPGLAPLWEGMLGISAGPPCPVRVPWDPAWAGPCMQGVGGSGLLLLPANSLFQLVSLSLRPQRCPCSLVPWCQEREEDLPPRSPGGGGGQLHTSSQRQAQALGSLAPRETRDTLSHGTYVAQVKTPKLVGTHSLKATQRPRVGDILLPVSFLMGPLHGPEA